MTTNTITFRLSHFYALEEVDIKIDGITLLNGPHHTGKDKLLSFIHDTIRFPLLFESYKTDEFWFTLEKLYDHLVLLSQLIIPFSGKKKLLPSFSSIQSFDSEEDWIYIVDKLEQLYYDIYLKNAPANHIPKDIYPENYSKDHFMYTIGINEDPVGYPVSKLFEPTRTHIRNHFKNANKTIHQRDEKLLTDYLKEQYAPVSLPLYYELRERNSIIAGSGIHKFTCFKNLKKVLYIDAPRFFSAPESWHMRCWEYIYGAFLERNGENLSCELTERLRELAGGEILQNIPTHRYEKYEPGIKRFDFTDFPETWFNYKARNGSILPLCDCSFDIIKFSLLERLIVNRIIDNDALVIFNDPENHLTPEQIEDFAWIIARLHAKHNVRFLFSSYNPDMGKFLSLACDKEGITKGVKIYNAQKGLDDYKYIFR